MKIFDRYILREIALPFCMGLLVMTFLLLMGKILQLADLVINKGVSLGDIAALIFHLMPSFLLFTVPIALLLSILVGLGRLAGDNEITVLRGAGVSIYRILLPVAAASLAALLATALLSLVFVPRSNNAVKGLLFDIVKQNAGANIKERIFNDDFRGILLYADRIPSHGNFLEGVIISDNRAGVEPSVIFAEKAYLISDPSSLTVSLRIEKGSTHIMDLKSRRYRKMDFSSYDINLNMEAPMKGQNNAKASTEMTPAELWAAIGSPGTDGSALRELQVELNKRYALPLACIVFALLAAPLALRVRKSATAKGFAVGICLVLVYYVLLLGGSALAETGRMPVLLGAWLPNAVFAVSGLYLLAAAGKERMPLVSGINRIVKIIRGEA